LNFGGSKLTDIKSENENWLLFGKVARTLLI